MDKHEADEVLDDIEGSSVEDVQEALQVLGIAQEPASELADAVDWYRTMFHLGLMIVVVEGAAFGFMVWQGMYVLLPTIVYTIAAAAFTVGKLHERRKHVLR